MVEMFLIIKIVYFQNEPSNLFRCLFVLVESNPVGEIFDFFPQNSLVISII